MRVRVNKDLCSACGVCEGPVPAVCSLETEPYAVVPLDPVPEELEDLVREAAENCPEGAIEIVEVD
jgi:ferredoxin